MDAKPLNLVRPEVPAELAAVVAKMMAKEPERRFQHPGEVAQALTPFFKQGGDRPHGPRKRRCRELEMAKAKHEPADERLVPTQRTRKPPERALKTQRPVVGPSPDSSWQELIELERPEPAVETAAVAAPLRRPHWYSWPVVGASLR